MAARQAGGVADVRLKAHHSVEIYSNDGTLCASVVEYLAGGLVEGQTVLVIATPEHRASFAALLRSACFDVERACRDSRLRLMDARETLDEFMVNDEPDPAKFQAKIGGGLRRLSGEAGGRRIRAYGEMVDVLWREGNRRAAIRLEELWNDLGRTHPFDLLCAYRMESAPNAGDAEDVRRIHEVHDLHRCARPSGDQFRHLVECVKDCAIYMLDPQGIITTWNRGAARLKGFQAEDVLGRHFSMLYPSGESSAATCKAELDAALRDGRRESEGWRARKDGTSFWASAVLTAVYDDGGRHIGFAKVTRDLTERKKAEEALLREQVARAAADATIAEAQRASRVSELFMGMLSHDLRTPLGSIATAAQILLRAGPADAQVRKSAAAISSSSERMYRMIRQLLDFTRIRLGGGLRIAASPTDLGVVLETIAMETEAAFPCEIQREIRGNVVGIWDADLVAQVLTNLLGNAAQHGTAGNPISVRIDGGRPDEVDLEVSNAGSIPPDVAREIFEPFRGGARQRYGARGLGLGLFITREIVLAHHGNVEAASSGVTTTFRVRLPRVPLTASPAR